jgi:MATE family multidrug resistance protein
MYADILQSFNNIIKVAYPVVISMFSMNIMIFIDRAFVAKCNLTEFAATMPACANIAFTIEGISVLPVVGLGTAMSVIVGHEKGAEH